MIRILQVTLDYRTTPPSAVVTGNSTFTASPLKHLIVWQLTGNAAKGRFRRHGWIPSGPKPGIFGGFRLIIGTPFALMTDKHTGKTTKGQWSYRLEVVVGGKKYATKPPRMEGGTPNIKNN
jgi:hypothetical protein